jgi:hypothetical protein
VGPKQNYIYCKQIQIVLQVLLVILSFNFRVIFGDKIRKGKIRKEVTTTHKFNATGFDVGV